MAMDMRTNELTPQEWGIVDHFHMLIYRRATTWMGWPILKWPGDILLYQDLLWSLQPDTLIECGTGMGGSALFFASIMDLIDTGHVVSIDLETYVPGNNGWAFGHPVIPPSPFLSRTRPEHPRITYLTGNTESPEIIEQVTRLTHGTTMVVLDSAHDAPHVLKECQLYAPFVTVGSYLVVEDVNMHGHPLIFTDEDYPGPYEAAMAFMQAHEHFRWDVRMTERFLLSYNAWLVRQG